MEKATPCLQSQIGDGHNLRGWRTAQATATVSLSVVIRWGPVMTAVNGTGVARLSRTGWSRSGWPGWGLALVCLGDLVEESLGTNGLLAVDSGEPFGGGLVRLGCLDDGAVGPDGCSGDQGEGEGVARAGVNLGGALRAVHHDGRV